MNDLDPPDGRPWYRYFWPWFIVALLCASIAGGVSTVLIAFANQDSLVSDEWYEKGMEINRRLESEHAALRRSIRARLQIDDLTGEVRVELTGEGIQTLRELSLELSHPTLASRDRSLALVRSDSGVFRGELSEALSGRWYAALAPRVAASGGDPAATRTTPTDADDWRLTATLQLPASEPILIGSRK